MGLIMQEVLGCGTEPKPGGEVLVWPGSVAELPSVQQEEDLIQRSRWDN